MTLSAVTNRMTTISLSPPSTPRLRMEHTGSRRTLLDGAWWPRSTDPVAELPGLVLAIDTIRGPVTRLVLSAAGWDTRPRRLGVNGRVLRVGYFTSQPVSLLTAICGADDDRVDLLVIPPHTTNETADAAMALAATTGNLLHAPDILAAAVDGVSQDAWETDGGRTAPLRVASDIGDT